MAERGGGRLPKVKTARGSGRASSSVHQVVSIRQERLVSGPDAPERHFLMRWAGYHATWEAWRLPGDGEAGDPVSTWEPLAHVQGTEALASWESRVPL
jgi:hypothetical protein